ncbi:MAG: cysteine synthase family protein [Bacteroidota bacterium]
MTTSIKTPQLFSEPRLDHVAQLIGRTPLYEITRAWSKPGVRILAKLEWQQLGGSVKSRPAFHILKAAIETGALRPGQRLLDATSGNTGIAYASIGAALGIPVSLCLPENASPERIQILRSLGVELILTSKYEGTDGAQMVAKERFADDPGRYFYADQYANEANWRAHYDTTAVEIWEQTEGQISHFVAGLGTTGTFTGVGRRLKEYRTDIQLVALQPNNPLHGLEGWKHLETAIVPPIYAPDLADRYAEADTEAAYATIKHVAQTEGLLLSPSAAANLNGAVDLARDLDEGLIVTTFADDSAKYAEVYRHIF